MESKYNNKKICNTRDTNSVFKQTNKYYRSKHERTIQAMYLWCNIEVFSCNNCRSGKTINITYSMDTLVALGMWLVMRMRRIVICGLLGFITYSKLFLKRYDFREKLLYVMCVF